MKLSLPLFRRTYQLQDQIDIFFDNLSEASVIYKLAIRAYFDNGVCEEFETRLERIHVIESDSDALRREIEKQLYSNTLIPDSRGNVLNLIERVDELLSVYECSLWDLQIEKPQIPKEFHEKFIKLTRMVIKAADEVCLSSRAFFNSPHDVPAYNHKVMLYEKESDMISAELKTAIFSSDIDLSSKLHYREFVEKIDDIADKSEDIADRLAIYAIQRII